MISKYLYNLLSKMKFALMLIICLLLYSSCEYDHYYSEQNYYGVRGGHVRNAETNDPVEGLTVGIFTLKDELSGIIKDTIINYDLIIKCKTNSDGRYTFLINEGVERHGFKSRYASIVRETAFDSTKIEWQYFNNKIYSSSSYMGIDDLKNIFYVEPAGWVFFNITDQINNTIIVECEGSKLVNDPMFGSWRLSNYNNEGYFYWIPQCIAVKPSTTHTFNFYELKNEKEIFLKSCDFFIKNSFDHNSTADSVLITCDTINVKVYN